MGMHRLLWSIVTVSGVTDKNAPDVEPSSATSTTISSFICLVPPKPSPLDHRVAPAETTGRGV